MPEKPTTLVNKAKMVAKGKTLTEAGIDPLWIRTYGKIARRCNYNQSYRLERYPYSARKVVSDFMGGFFNNKTWTLHHDLKSHASMRPLWWIATLASLQCYLEYLNRMGTSQLILLAIRFGILRMPDRKFWPGAGVELSEVLDDWDSGKFRQQELESGLTERLWMEIMREKSMAAKADGVVISLAFVVWTDGDEGKKKHQNADMSFQNTHILLCLNHDRDWVWVYWSVSQRHTRTCDVLGTEIR